MIEIEFPVEGKPGSCIDEGYSKTDRSPYISYSLFNESGEIVFYTDFSRDVTPREIAESVENAAKDLLLDPCPEMVWDETQKIADMMLSEAEKINPGKS